MRNQQQAQPQFQPNYFVVNADLPENAPLINGPTADFGSMDNTPSAQVDHLAGTPYLMGKGSNNNA
jgi:hypothetical protein